MNSTANLEQSTLMTTPTPADWEIIDLGDIINYTKGYAFKSSDYTADGVRIIRVSDTSYDSITTISPIFTAIEKQNIYSRWCLKEFDIILTTVGSKPPMYDSMVGKTVLVSEEFSGSLLNQNAVIIRNKKNLKAIQILLLNHFKTKKYVSFIEGILRGNANQASITLKELFEFKVPLPIDTSEQEAIASALLDMDSLINELDKLINKKRNIKTAIMHELMGEKKLLAKRDSDWIVKRIADIAHIFKGTQLKSQELIEGGSYAHLNGGVGPSGYTEKFNAEGQSIAVSEGGNSCGHVQFMKDPYWCGGHCYSIVAKNVDNSFLYHVLKSKQSHIMALRVGSGLPNVQKKALANFIVRIPSDRGEQVTIAKALTDLDAELASLEARLKKNRQLKLGMMQKLLTGTIRLLKSQPEQ